MKLSTLWIFVTLNYLYCDILGLMDAESLKGFLAGNVGGMDITQGFLLGASVLMEIPMSMVLLSRLLPYRANRWANIIAGTIMTIVQFGSLFAGSSPTAYYLFFSAVEISCTVGIVWYAWRSR
jgi:MFS family permease